MAAMAGTNLFAGEASGRGGNLALLFGEVFRGEDFSGGAGLEKETAAGGGNDGRGVLSAHGGSFSNCSDTVRQQDRDVQLRKTGALRNVADIRQIRPSDSGVKKQPWRLRAWACARRSEAAGVPVMLALQSHTMNDIHPVEARPVRCACDPTDSLPPARSADCLPRLEPGWRLPRKTDFATT